MEKEIKCEFKDCINYSVDGVPFFKDCYFCSRNDGESESIKDCYQNDTVRRNVSERRAR